MQTLRQKTITTLVLLTAVWVTFSVLYAETSLREPQHGAAGSRALTGDAASDVARAANGEARLLHRWKLFLVGTTRYVNVEDDAQLHDAVKDVEALKARFIELGVPQEDIVTLTTESSGALVPVKKNIEAAFGRFITSLESGDNAFVYLSGHGFYISSQKRAYYAPEDVELTSREEIAESTVSIDDMLDALRNCPASIKWMTVDACRDDPWEYMDNPNARGLSALNNIGLAKHSANEPDAPIDALIFLQACEDGRQAIEAPEMEQSMLNYSILEALQTDDNPADRTASGELTLIDLLSYVQKRTEELAKSIGLDNYHRPAVQRPIVTCDKLPNVTVLSNLRHGGLTAAQRQVINAEEENFNSFLRNGDVDRAQKTLQPLADYYPGGTKAEQYQTLRRRLADAKGSPLPTNSRKSAPATDPLSPGCRPGESKTITIAGVDVNFRWAPPGSFLMGSPKSEQGRWYGNREALHEVVLTRGFWIAETETTQELWQAVMGKNPSTSKGDNQLPVESVSWNDCQAFVEKLNHDHGSALPRGYQYALPTEAQWEYACRAWTTTPFYFGFKLNGDNANCDGTCPYGTNIEGEKKGKITPVKSYAPNPWGIYDMCGNVSEWCADLFDQDYYTTASASKDPTGPTDGFDRVARGGSYYDLPTHCRSAQRNHSNPGEKYRTHGVRLALVPSPSRR